MYKISHLTIDGFHHINHAEYEFNNLNYLYGLNGAGKSTILQAIQLGLLGYIPGTDKNKTAIFRHCNCDMLRVGLTLEPSLIITRTWMKSGNNIIVTCATNPNGFDIESIIKDIELPIFNFNEFIGMTANKLKDWFINFLPKDEVEIDWDRELRTSLDNAKLIGIDDDMISSDVDKIDGCGLSGVEQVRWANDYFKQMVSLKKTEVNQAESTIKTLIFYDDIPVGMSVEDIQNQIDTKAKIRNQITAYSEAVKCADNLKSQLSKFSFTYPMDNDPEYVKATSDLESTKSTVKTYVDTVKEIDAKLNDIRIMVEITKSELNRVSSLNSNDNCPFNDRPCETARMMKDKNIEHLEKLQHDLVNYQNDIDKLSATRYDAWDAQVKAEDNLKHYQNVVNQIEEQYKIKAQIDSLLDGLVVPEANLMVVESELKTLQDELVKVEVNELYNKSIDKFTQVKAKAQMELDAYKLWVNLTGVNDLQIRVNATNPFDVLSNDMTTTIRDIMDFADGVKFITEGKSNSFDFGIISNGRFVSYDLLSSGEKCVFVLAMLISIVRASDKTLSLILIDDMFDHLDNDKILKVFNKLIDGYDDIQFIFAGVKELKDHDCIIGVVRK